MRRVNIRKILADPVLRKDLFVRAIRFMQAVEGIDTTEAQAARAYEKVRGEIKTARRANLGLQAEGSGCNNRS